MATTVDLVELLGRRQASSVLVQLGGGFGSSTRGPMRGSRVELQGDFRVGRVVPERQMPCALLDAQGDGGQAFVEIAPAIRGRLGVDDRGEQ